MAVAWLFLGSSRFMSVAFLGHVFSWELALSLCLLYYFDLLCITEK